MYKSARYIRTKNNTYKLLKDFNDCVDVYVMKQEARNQMAAAQQAGQLQEMEARGQADVDRMVAQGSAQVDQLKGQGQLASMQAQMQKQGTLMGMAQSEATAAGQAAATAESNKWGAIGGAVKGLGGLLSDRRLKKNIKLIGSSPSGLNIYAFEYIDKIFGDGVYQGVMSEEIPSDAIMKHESGYDAVDYSKLDVEFKNIS